VESAPTRTLFRSTRMPYTEALINSIPVPGQPRHTRFHTIGGRPPSLVDRPLGCPFAPRCRYVQPRCLEEQPPLVAAGTPDHSYRCWFPVGTPEGRDALERNAAEQTPVTS